MFFSQVKQQASLKHLTRTIYHAFMELQILQFTPILASLVFFSPPSPIQLSASGCEDGPTSVLCRQGTHPTGTLCCCGQGTGTPEETPRLW